MTAIIHKGYFPYLLLLVLAIPLFFLNIHAVHSWGDDYAQYIKEAQNIAEGKPYYLSTWIYNPYNPVYAPPQYPPGFPLLLAPVVKMFGLSISALCYYNSFLATCLLLALYAFFRHHASKMAAVCMAVMISYSAYMVYLKGHILADMPCLLFITLYLSLRQYSIQSPVRVMVLVFLAAFAIQIRSQAIALVIAEGGFWVLSSLITAVKSRRIHLKTMLSNPSLKIVAGTAMLHLLCDKVIFAAPHTTTSFYHSIFSKAISEGLFRDPYKHYEYLQKAIASFWFSPDATILSSDSIHYITLFVVISAMVGFVLKAIKMPDVTDLFFLVMCFVLWHFPYQDTRYYLPLFPILTLYTYYTARTAFYYLPPRIRYTGAVLSLVVFLYMGKQYFYNAATQYPLGMVPEKRELDAFRYIETHVADNDIILFVKPRVLALYTGKKTINTSWELTFEGNKRVFDSFNVKYVLVLNGLEDYYFKDYMLQVQHPIDSAVIADGYTLYTIR